MVDDAPDRAAAAIFDHGWRPETQATPICGAPDPQCAKVIIEALEQWPSHPKISYAACWALAHIIYVYDHQVPVQS